MVQNVISKIQNHDRELLQEEAGQSGRGKHTSISFKCHSSENFESRNFLSLDKPESGSGDHENIYDDQHRDSEVYDSDGKLYSDCVRKAVNIREIKSHSPWHSLSNNPFLFSDLSGMTKEFLTMTKEALDEAKKSIRYTKAVDSAYG